MLSKLRDIGPGTLVAAAFVGPGTVTACTIAGAQFGYALLWAVLFATIATILLQDMAARLGVVTGRGLGSNLGKVLADSNFRKPLFLLIGIALYIGNAAYEGGNLSGAALGVTAIFSESATETEMADVRGVVLITALIAGALLMSGKYWLIERLLIGLVLLMAIAFIVAVAIVRPDIGGFFQGLLIPSIPAGSIITATALIGTTIVPYNLFLHAAIVRNRWKGEESLSLARNDSAISIGLGGLITILILTTAAASMFSKGLDVANVADMARQLEPAFGKLAVWVLGVGLFAAGLSSAITAPLATSYAVTEILGGGESSPRTRRFRWIALSVLAVGTNVALTGIKPVDVIIAAQVANGLLLPIIAGFLLYAMNRKSLLGEHINGWKMNLAGSAVVVLTAGIGIRAILYALDIIN